MLQAETPYQFKCSDAPRGAIRVRTPYAYHGGERIDVYVLKRDDVIEITDFGDILSQRMRRATGIGSAIEDQLGAMREV